MLRLSEAGYSFSAPPFSSVLPGAVYSLAFCQLAASSVTRFSKITSTRALLRRGGEDILFPHRACQLACPHTAPALNPMKNTLAPMLIPAKVLRRLKQEDVFHAAHERKRAERTREHTQNLINDFTNSTPEQRAAARKALARSTYAHIDEITANADLVHASSAAAMAAMTDIRIDDLDSLFAARAQFPDWLCKRIENAFAKIHWKRRKDGKPGYFNVAVHENGIPLDKMLAILCHLNPQGSLIDASFSQQTDSIIECGLFAKVKNGKFHYGRRCQRGDDCDLCNYLNISDGLKMLKVAYNKRTFNRGGNFFGITIAPRRNPADARAVGRTLQPDDWDHENKNSLVFGDARHAGAFPYPEPLDEEADWHTESSCRRFLGAAQYALGKLVKNGWLDGIRGRVENRISFLPFTSHPHWHCVGSSLSEHNAQSMAEFIKEQFDSELRQTCRGVSADVMVGALSTAMDIQRWVKYCNKPMDYVGAVLSVYNRHPGLRRNDQAFREFMTELNLLPQRLMMLFKGKRFTVAEDGERGAHTYNLRKHLVLGNHRFGRRCILSESPQHREWRIRCAENKANLRHK